jgi:sugar lactone lactonase YvrE
MPITPSLMNPKPLSGEARLKPTGRGHVLDWRGQGLVRPECVLATSAGDLYTADWRGGVAHIRADASQVFYGAEAVDGVALKPNGIALLRDGSFLLAHLGDEEGGVFHLARSGATRPWLRTVEGVDLPPTNFVVADALGRTWITVSTRLRPRSLGYRKDCRDGFIVRVDARGAAIVADGLGYTNEAAVHPDGRWLYVNETFGRRLSRYPLDAQGNLGAVEVVTEFGPGTYPDGLAFDEQGHAWIASIVSNRLIRVAPDGSQTLWLEDADAAHLARAEQAYRDDCMGRTHLETPDKAVLRGISSLAFCGPDLRRAALGCLDGNRLAVVDLPIRGVRPLHWNYRAND